MATLAGLVQLESGMMIKTDMRKGHGAYLTIRVTYFPHYVPPKNRKKRNAILVWEENGGVLMNKNWSGFASRIPSKDLGFGNEKPFPEVDGGPLHLGP